MNNCTHWGRPTSRATSTSIPTTTSSSSSFLSFSCDVHRSVAIILGSFNINCYMIVLGFHRSCSYGESRLDWYEFTKNYPKKLHFEWPTHANIFILSSVIQVVLFVLFCRINNKYFFWFLKTESSRRQSWRETEKSVKPVWKYFRLACATTATHVVYETQLNLNLFNSSAAHSHRLPMKMYCEYARYR